MSKSLKVTLLYCVVLFLDLLEMTVLNVGLPSIAEGLSVSVSEMAMAVTCFVWGLTLVIPLAGWLGKRFGNKKIFILGQLIFVTASTSCFFIGSLEQLLVLRALQGCAGGLILPVGLAFLMRALPPEERARSMGRVSLIPRLAPALGPILAGYTLAFLGWRWLFIVKLPISLGCLVISYFWLEDDEPSATKSFDWRGLLLCSTSLGALLLCLAYLQLGSLAAIGLAVLSAVSFIRFIKTEASATDPIIPLQLFSSRMFCRGNLMQGIAYCVLLGGTYLTSLYFQEGLGFDPVVTGWVLSSSTIGMISAVPVFATQYNRLGPSFLSMLGFSLWGIAIAGLSVLTEASGPIVAAGFMVLMGGGASLVISTGATAVFSEIPKELMGAASSVFSLVREVSNCLGVALSSVFLSLFIAMSGELGGYHAVYWMLCCMIILGGIMGFLIESPKPESTVCQESS